MFPSGAKYSTGMNAGQTLATAIANAYWRPQMRVPFVHSVWVHAVALIALTLIPAWYWQYWVWHPVLQHEYSVCFEFPAPAVTAATIVPHAAGASHRAVRISSRPRAGTEHVRRRVRQQTMETVDACSDPTTVSTIDPQTAPRIEVTKPANPYVKENPYATGYSMSSPCGFQVIQALLKHQKAPAASISAKHDSEPKSTALETGCCVLPKPGPQAQLIDLEQPQVESVVPTAHPAHVYEVQCEAPPPMMCIVPAGRAATVIAGVNTAGRVRRVKAAETAIATATLLRDDLTVSDAPYNNGNGAVRVANVVSYDYDAPDAPEADTSARAVVMKVIANDDSEQSLRCARDLQANLLQQVSAATSSDRGTYQPATYDVFVRPGHSAEVADHSHGTRLEKSSGNSEVDEKGLWMVRAAVAKMKPSLRFPTTFVHFTVEYMPMSADGYRKLKEGTPAVIFY